MIDKKELRIGNKVSSPRHNLAVATIQGMLTNDLVLLEEVSTYDFFSSIEPIKLTAEWLEKFGFVDNGSHDYADHSWEHPSLSAQFDGEAFYYTDDWGIHHLGVARFVHQFQNNFYCMAVEELIINPLQP